MSSRPNEDAEAAYATETFLVRLELFFLFVTVFSRLKNIGRVRPRSRFALTPHGNAGALLGRQKRAHGTTRTSTANMTLQLVLQPVVLR